MNGEVRGSGLVVVDGELWRAHTSDGTQLLAGEHVEVNALNGLELTVTPIQLPQTHRSRHPPTPERTNHALHPHPPRVRARRRLPTRPPARPERARRRLPDP